MPHAVLMYRPKRRLTKRHHLRIVKLKNQQKTKFVHLNLSGIADVLWLATDGLENANLQHGELIWLDFHHICLNKTFSSGLLQKKKKKSYYLLKSDAQNIYQTINNMSGYLTTGNASTIYQTITNMQYYLTNLNASLTYQTIYIYQVCIYIKKLVIWLIINLKIILYYHKIY